MTCIPENCAGSFTPFHIREKRDLKAGMIRKPISILAVRIPGQDLAWMKKKELSSHLSDRLVMIFMAEKERETLCSRIAFWHWMQIQEKEFGIFRPFIMISGTETCLRHPFWSILPRMDAVWRLWHR